ncbi:MAG TPA: glycosyltransferase [Chthoniobacterales bacterium]|nr:glycosyltransferase [Chthoniobacterales bacterium]
MRFRTIFRKVVRVFRKRGDDKVREFYMHMPEVQRHFPLALLPPAQKEFIDWLLGEGRAQHRLSDEEIGQFIHETSEEPARGIAETYLINPDWQKRFPSPLDRQQQTKLLEWLRGKFPEFPALKEICRLTGRAIERARRSGRDAARSSGVNILAHFCYPSGLQQAALATWRALESVGVPTSCRDVPSGVDTDLDPRAPWLGLEIHPTTIINIAPATLFEVSYQRAGLARREGVYRIANWYWELEDIPLEWARFASLIDEIWAPSPFVAEAMRPVMPVPIFEMLPAVSIGRIEPVRRRQLNIMDHHFVFLFAFDLCSQFERKNPLGVIRAFRKAFSRAEAATLLIKTTRGDQDLAGFNRLKNFADENGVLLVNELASRARAYGYIDMCDCFISLHRSEGFGLGLAEAMLLGKPVIATNYSGNLAFMNHENSLLVDYTLTDISESGPIYKQGSRWAMPNEDHAAAMMRAVYENREEAFAHAGRAQPEIKAKLALEAAGRRMKKRLDEIAAKVGAVH